MLDKAVLNILMASVFVLNLSRQSHITHHSLAALIGQWHDSKSLLQRDDRQTPSSLASSLPVCPHLHPLIRSQRRLFSTASGAWV